MTYEPHRSDADSAAKATAFIAKWSPSGGVELANSQSFLRDLCDLLDVPHPDSKIASDHADDNAYVFEKDVIFKHGDGTTSGGRIDLYKRGCASTTLAAALRR